jgi:Glycosyltransferase
MFQNMLPFDSVEAARYGTSWMRLRLMILRSIQMSTFTSANGVIFLSEQARERLMQTAVKLRGRNTVIPHGVEPRFMMPPRPQKALAYYSMFRPFRLLYVSIVDVYKHQWKVAEAVARLRRRGYPVQMDLVGSSYAPALRRLNRTLQRVDRGSAFIRYRGSYPHSDLGEIYHDSDAFVFASSCENMPNILLEAMASALPIASSNRDPMPSVLGNAAFYFNPESVSETENAIETMLMDVDGRQRSAQQAYDAAQKYSWRTCTDQIFQFLVEVGRNCN